MLGFFCGKIFLWEAFVWSAARKVFWKWEGFFFFRFYQLPTQTPPTPLSPPKRGFRLFSFLSRDWLSGNSLGAGKFMKKEHKGKLTPPYGEG